MVGLSQRPDKRPMFDFYLMHTANTMAVLPVYQKSPHLPPAAKARLIEVMGRLQLMLYLSAQCPDLYLDEIRNYKPLIPGDWETVFVRVCDYEDDGHVVKLVRALATAEQHLKQHEGKPGFILTSQDYFTLAHMVMDSTEFMDHPEHVMPDSEKLTGNHYSKDLHPLQQLVLVRWLRWTGYPEAWADVMSREAWQKAVGRHP